MKVVYLELGWSIRKARAIQGFHSRASVGTCIGMVQPISVLGILTFSLVLKYSNCLNFTSSMVIESDNISLKITHFCYSGTKAKRFGSL